MVAFSGFASLVVWAFSRVGRWILINLSRFQALYNQMASWLEEQGIAVASLWADHFNVSWIVGLMQKLTGQVNTTLSFWLVVLVYVIIGLLEAQGTARKIETLPNRRIARVLLAGSEEAAAKIRRYMVVRTMMSVLTGVLVWAFAMLFGLPLAPLHQFFLVAGGAFVFCDGLGPIGGPHGGLLLGGDRGRQRQYEQGN